MNPVIRVPQFANTKKLNLAAITIALLMVSGSSIRAQSESTRQAAGDVAKPQTSSPTDFVDTLNSTFGKQTTAQRNLLFLPGSLPVGIEPADPMIHFRDKAYPVSYDRRHAAETKK